MFFLFRYLYEKESKFLYIFLYVVKRVLRLIDSDGCSCDFSCRKWSTAASVEWDGSISRRAPMLTEIVNLNKSSAVGGRW